MTVQKARVVKRYFNIFFIGNQGFLIVFGIICGMLINLLMIPLSDNPCNGALSHLSSGLFHRLEGKQPVEEEDFEPRVVTRDPEEIAQKMATSRKVIRPRFSSQELSIKEKLCVVIVSGNRKAGAEASSSLLESYAVPLNTTLRPHVDKLLFFMDGMPSKALSALDLPLITFPEQETSHTLMLRVLQYLSSKYSRTYDYFMLVYGDNSLPYINGRGLHRSLSHTSISHSLHMGLPLARGSHYCSLKKGIVLSNTVLAAAAEDAVNGGWCMKHARMRHSADVNFGQCVLHATALPCNPTVQEHVYKSVSLQDKRERTTSSSKKRKGDGNAGFYDEDYESEGFDEEELLMERLQSKLDSLNNSPDAPSTITGLKSHSSLYAAHWIILGKEIGLLQNSLNKTRIKISAVREKIDLTPQENTWPLGSPAPNHPPTRFDVISWTAFNSTHVFMPDEHTNVALLSDSLLRDLTSVVLAGASHITNTSDGRFLLQRLNHGYYRVDPLRGTDYLLSLSFRDATTGQLVSKNIEGTRSITVPEFLPMPYVTEKTEVTLLVTVKVQQTQQAIDFVQRYVKTKQLSANSILLLVLLLPNTKLKPEAYSVLKSTCEDAVATYQVNIKLISVASDVFTVTSKSNNLSPSTQIIVMDQLVRKLGSNTLVAMLPVAASINVVALDRIRMNTIQGWQVYSPIAWGMFHPGVISAKDALSYRKMEVRGNVGYFMRYDYFTTSFYVSDYKKARKKSAGLFPIIPSSNRISSTSFTRPPLSLYRLFISFSQVHILRAPEPYLKLPYESFRCAPVPSNHTTRSTNQLHSDLSLLMGASKADNNAAFYRYVLSNYFISAEDESSGNGDTFSAADFQEDEFCQERLLHSFGTRAQLSKVLMEYDSKHGTL